jgi:hypothetical protein
MRTCQYHDCTRCQLHGVQDYFVHDRLPDIGTGHHTRDFVRLKRWPGCWRLAFQGKLGSLRTNVIRHEIRKTKSEFITFSTEIRTNRARPCWRMHVCETEEQNAFVTVNPSARGDCSNRLSTTRCVVVVVVVACMCAFEL